MQITKDELRVQIGERIKKYRQEKGISQFELAQQLNIDRASLSHYESGERLPDTLVLWDIADYLGVSLDELVGRQADTE